MKNTYKFLSVIAVIAIIGLSMSACEVDAGDDGVKKSLRITGITGTDVPTTGNVAVGIADIKAKGKSNLVAYSEVSVSSTVDIPLISAKRQGEQYTGTGEYYIILVFDNGTDTDSDDVNYVYSNGTTSALKYNITQEVTTIAFDKFIRLND